MPPVLHRVRKTLVAEHRLLAGFLVALALAVGFGSLAGEMTEGETGALDKTIELAFRHPHDLATPIGPVFLKTAMIDITALGSETILALVTIAAVAFLLLRRRRRQAAFVAAAIAGGAVLSGILKSQFARARPDIVPHLVTVNSHSFPSGHAMNSAIVYLTIAVLIARSYRDRSSRTFIVGSALVATFTIGLSRVYLGVHWPSDVAAGWLVGGAWALGMGVLATALQKRHKIEQPSEATGTPEPDETSR